MKKKTGLWNYLQEWIAAHPPVPGQPSGERRRQAHRDTPHGIIEDAIDDKKAARRLFDIIFDRVAGQEFNQRITPFVDEDGKEWTEFVDMGSTEEVQTAYMGLELRRRNVKNAQIKLREAAIVAAQDMLQNHPEIGVSFDRLVSMLINDEDDEKTG